MKASGRSASTSNCMGRSGRTWKWNHVEIRGSERSSLEASAEVLLEASTETSTGSIRGSFQFYRKWKLSTAPMEASIDSTEASIAHGSELRCRWKFPRKLSKLLEASIEAKQAPIEVVEASNKSCRGKVRGSFHGSAIYYRGSGFYGSFRSSGNNGSFHGSSGSFQTKPEGFESKL